MAVAFDAAATTDDFGVTSLSVAVTVGSGSNRAFCIGGVFFANITNIAADLGGAGAAASVVASTNLFSSIEVQLMAGVNPSSGSQTAHMSWTGSASASLGVITASGVDQTTPMNGGKTNSTFGTSLNIGTTAISSTSGDLTVSICGDESGDKGESVTSPQLRKTNDFGSMAIGDGSGSATHAWTRTGSQTMVGAGANFVAAGAGGGGAVIPVFMNQYRQRRN